MTVAVVEAASALEERPPDSLPPRHDVVGNGLDELVRSLRFNPQAETEIALVVSNDPRLAERFDRTLRLSDGELWGGRTARAFLRCQRSGAVDSSGLALA